MAAGRRSAARTRDGHGCSSTAGCALCRLAEVHALWSALLVGGRAALAPMHPATEPARMQEQARRRRHLKNPAPPFSSSAVQWRAVPEKLRRPIENRWTLIKRTQSGTGPLLPVRPGLQRVPLAPVVVCAAARALRAAGATITTLPPLGYWRARRAARSDAHASEGRTTNTELGGRGLRQPTKKPAGRAFRWAVGGASSKFLARHGCAPADAIELAPLVEFDGRIIDIPPPRLRDRLQVLRLHVAVLV